MTVEIWMDVVCPWCYIGKRRFEAALARFAHRDEVEVVLRSFELDPLSPPVRQTDVLTHLSRKYGVSQAQAERMERRVVDLAAAEGLVIRAERVLVNTRDAQRLIHLAAARGRQAEMAERLFAAHFAEAQTVSDPETLVRLAAEAGLDPEEARRALESGAYDDAVTADEDEARALGAGGVPFFVIDRRYGVSGAQPAEVLVRVLEQAWAERHAA